LTEPSTFYLTEVLGLAEYLRSRHLRKMGLRFFFPSPDGEFKNRPEFGSSVYDPVEAFQIDRGLLENDLRRLNREAGILDLQGCKVVDIVLGGDGAPHRVRYLRDARGSVEEAHCRWVIDAMGRRRFLQRKVGLAEPASQTCSAAWFRVPGRVDVGNLVSDREHEWHNRVLRDQRYFSTNHLMGFGRWVWLIPLSTGCTSIGIVAREDCVRFEEFNSAERALAWLQRNEAGVARLLECREFLDFKGLRHYAYSSTKVFSEERWACTGDSGVFSDPLFSPGITQIGLANCMITDLIQHEYAGPLSAQTVEHYNQALLGFNLGATWITQPHYRLFGNPVVMAAKLLWDVVSGWVLNGPLMVSRTFLDSSVPCGIRPLAARLTKLSVRMGKFFLDWGAMAEHRASVKFFDYSSVPGLVRAYPQSLEPGKSPERLAEDFQRGAEYLEELAQALFFIALVDVMPGASRCFPDPFWIDPWNVTLDVAQWETSPLFSPSSAPRDLKPLLRRLSEMFGLSCG
jgi:hypothetical protein